MTRLWFGLAAALTLCMSLLVHENRVVAQQSGDASAEAEADTSNADADASADASAADSSDQAGADASADTSAETGSSSASDTGAAASAETSADADAATSDDASVPPPSNDSQAAPSDRQGGQTDAADANRGKASQEADRAIPPRSNDPNARQPREQSRLIEGQQPAQPGAAADRGRMDPNAAGRANVRGDWRGRRDDFRAGIQFGRATDRGLTINSIERNSFYYNSGLRRGDIIVTVDGRRIRNDADFMRFVIVRPGARVPVVVWRDGRRETVYVVYRDVARIQPDNRQYAAGGAYLGVTFDAQVRDAAVVAGVNPGSPAQEAGLQPGDIILALNGQEIRAYPDAIQTIRSMRPGEELEIVVERARAERQVVAVLDAQPNVRTATRPDVQVERETTIVEPRERVEVEVDRDNDGRLLDRDRNNDRVRDGRLLPRVRN